MVETLPVFTTHSTAGVPISYSLSCTVVGVTEEAAGWGLTGCRGTERRFRHPSSGPKRKQSNTADTVAELHLRVDLRMAGKKTKI